MAPKWLSLDTYKARQERLAARAGAKALAVVRPMVGKILSPSDIRAIASHTFEDIVAERSAAEELAAMFYMSERVKMLGEALPDLEAPAEKYGIRNLIKGLTAVMSPGQPLVSETPAVTTVSRHVKSAARRQAVGLSLVDAQSKGWARTSGGTSSCSFCLMLIGRGPVYRSRESAGDSDMRRFHNACDCVAVPVFDRQSFPGRDEFKRAETLWRKSTKGKSGPDALKAFRAAITEDAPGGQDAFAA